MTQEDQKGLTATQAAAKPRDKTELEELIGRLIDLRENLRRTSNNLNGVLRSLRGMEPPSDTAEEKPDSPTNKGKIAQLKEVTADLEELQNRLATQAGELSQLL